MHPLVNRFPKAMGAALLGILVILVTGLATPSHAAPPTGARPQAIGTYNGNQEFLVDPNRPILYYANVWGGEVSFINTTTGETIATIQVGPRPISLDLSGDGASLYVALSGDTKIAVVDIETRTVVRAIELGFAPWSVRDLRLDRLVVSGASDSQVHLVNETTGATLATVAPYYSLAIVEASPDGDAILVVDTLTAPVKVQRFGVTDDTLTFEAIDNHDLGSGFQMEAVDWLQGVMYIVPNWPPGLAMVSVNSLDIVGVLLMTPSPGLMALSPEGDTVYAVDEGPEGAVLRGFNTTTQALLGTQLLPGRPQLIGVPVGGESVLIAEPLQIVSLRSTIAPRYPQPETVLGYSPAYIEASVVRGIHASTVSSPTVSINGVAYDARIISSESAYFDILRMDLHFALNDGRSTLAATYIADGVTVHAEWNFTVDSTLPVPGVEFEIFEHPTGFRIPVPVTWERRVDQDISGVTVELTLRDLDHAVPTSIIVDTDRDSTVQENSAYLQELVDTFVQSIRSDDPSAQVFEGPIFRVLSNHSAATFVVLYSDGVVQKIGIVVSEVHQRFWLFLLTAGPNDYSSANPVYEHMLYGFKVTAAPPSNPPSVPTTWLLSALVLGLVASSILILRAIRKSRSGTGVQPIETVNYRSGNVPRGSNIPTGIEITCHRGFGQFLITDQPSLIAAPTEVTRLRWGAPVFVQLSAGVKHQLVVQFPYMRKACGVAEFSVELREGEVQAFDYKTPFIVYSSGKITRTR